MISALHRCVILVAGKIVRLRQKLVDLADSVKGFFGAKKQQDSAVEKLERLKVDICHHNAAIMQSQNNSCVSRQACSAKPCLSRALMSDSPAAEVGQRM